MNWGINFLKKTVFKKDNISTRDCDSVLLGALARSINAEIIVETGTFRGFTTIEFARQNPKARIITFEYDPKILKQARWLFRLSGFKNIEVIEGDVLEKLPALIRSLKKIDFVFLDDCKENYQKNFDAVYPFLSEHAIVSAHDTCQVVLESNAAIEFGKFLGSHPDFSLITVDYSGCGLTIAQKKPKP